MAHILLKYLVIFIVLAFCLPGAGWAEDSHSIAISCSIPAVPGLNAPLAENEYNNDNFTVVEEYTVLVQENSNEENNSDLLQELSEEEIMLAKGQTEKITVNTIYSR